MTTSGEELRQLAARFAGANVLVTGAFGFLGSHVARALVYGGANVVAFDCDTSPQRSSQINLIPGLRESLRIESGSVIDPPVLRRVCSETRFDHVFHFAAFSSAIETAAANPTETLIVNSTGVVHLLAAVAETGQSLRSFVHASTDKVYGDHGGTPYREAQHVYRCEGAYEASKLAADVFARSWTRCHEVPVAVLRLCNVFGPYDVGGIRSRLVPRAMAAIFRDHLPPVVYEGSAQHRRDYLYVDDCCRAILGVASHDLRGALEPGGAVFNVPGQANLTTAEMCSAVIEAAASVLDDVGDPLSARRVRDAGYSIRPPTRSDVPVIPLQRTCGERLTAATGFRPMVSMTDGLLRTAASYEGLWATRGSVQDFDAQNG
ncbi:MAG: NAD(P)-dependent oxidoreductase [Planctomycetes bacterium]|nr:NAD(P)-dependent oxidoreductase [Planctomycetota bacterium]